MNLIKLGLPTLLVCMINLSWAQDATLSPSSPMKLAGLTDFLDQISKTVKQVEQITGQAKNPTGNVGNLPIPSKQSPALPEAVGDVATNVTGVVASYAQPNSPIINGRKSLAVVLEAAVREDGKKNACGPYVLDSDVDAASREAMAKEITDSKTNRLIKLENVRATNKGNTCLFSAYKLLESDPFVTELTGTVRQALLGGIAYTKRIYPQPAYEPNRPVNRGIQLDFTPDQPASFLTYCCVSTEIMTQDEYLRMKQSNPAALKKIEDDIKGLQGKRVRLSGVTRGGVFSNYEVIGENAPAPSKQAPAPQAEVDAPGEDYVGMVSNTTNGTLYFNPSPSRSLDGRGVTCVQNHYADKDTGQALSLMMRNLAGKRVLLKNLRAYKSPHAGNRSCVFDEIEVL